MTIIKIKFMKQLFTILALLCFTTVGFSQTVWLFDNASGLGDGTSWNDANNWTDQATGTLHQVPAAGDEARLALNNSTITGTVPNIPGNVTIGGSKTVTLDLDMTIGDGTGTLHGIVMFNNGILNIATGRTITINVPANKEAVRLNSGKTNTLNVASGATVNIQQCLNGLFVDDATHTIDNDGTINITGATGSGVSLTNGTIINDGTIDISSSVNVGVNYDAGTFTNNGTLNITNSATDCLTIAAANFTNTGTMDLTTTGTTSGHTCIDIETGGVFTNSGDVTVNGGTGSARAVSAVGTLNNSGTMTLSGGNTNRTLSGDGGAINNMVCGFIDLGATRFFNAASTFTNNGFIKSTATALAGSGTSTNNGFYAGTTNFAASGGDNGVDVTSGNFTVDAMTSCAVTDIGVDAAYTWFKEAANTTQAGTNDVAGALTLDNGVWPGEAAGTKVVYSCFGAEFTMTIDQVDGGCLPVEMMYFNGELKGEAIALNWATASELNNAGFEVQKSADGVNWDVLGFVNGNGTTIETQTYTFIDENPLAKNYYRLKQMDYNDVFAYSNTIIINGNVKAQTATATVYPNPTKGTFNIEVEINDNAQVNVFNNFGQLVKTVQLTNQNTNVSLDEFANGLYYLQIVNGQTIQNQTIVKQ